jgi:hypothetical protein
MSLTPDQLDHARRVADAILYEGYLLYPYHQAAQKNQMRFQFGVLMPPAYVRVDPNEASASRTECLLECADDAEVDVTVRFLHLQRRLVKESSADGQLRDVATLTVAGTEVTEWDEATECEQRVQSVVSELLDRDRTVEFHISAEEMSEDLIDSGGRLAGCVVRRRDALDGLILMRAERVAGPYRALRLRLEVLNTTAPSGELRTRDGALAGAFIAAHSLIAVPGGTFLSMTDPPEWAAAEVAACQNVGTWPVLAGPADCTGLMLSSPVILYDHPAVAAESAGDLFDATEIDEILTLRTLTLTDAEKRQARATDDRAAELLDRLDDMPPEMLERMHGAIRYLRAAPAGAPAFGPASDSDVGFSWATREPSAGEAIARPSVPWWDPGSDASVSPETDHVVIDGITVSRDSRVRMRPGSRRADAQDLFLAGRDAVVEAVLFDVDGQVHLAVTPVDDPAADLQRRHGRFLYFAPDEVEPLEQCGTTPELAEGGER